MVSEDRPVSARLNAIVMGTNNPSQQMALEEARAEDEGSQCMETNVFSSL